LKINDDKPAYTKARRLATRSPICDMQCSRIQRRRDFLSVVARNC